MIQPMNAKLIPANVNLTELQKRNQYIAEPMIKGKRIIISKLNNQTKILYSSNSNSNSNSNSKKEGNSFLKKNISLINDNGFILDGIYNNKVFTVIDMLMYKRSSLDLTPLLHRKRIIEKFFTKLNNPNIKPLKYTKNLKALWDMFKDGNGIILKHRKSEYHTGTINHKWVIKKAKLIHKVQVFDYTSTKYKNISTLVTANGKLIFPSKRFKEKEEELLEKIPQKKVIAIIESERERKKSRGWKNPIIKGLEIGD